MNSPEQAMAIMLKGYELGLGLTASFEFVQVVMGKPALSPRGCLALIHQHSDLIEVEILESTNERCTVRMKRTNSGFEFTGSWSMDDAKRAGVVKPDSGWSSYPANMLRWRCIGFVADVVCPDLIGGLRRSDEWGAALDSDGNTVDGSWRDVTPPVPQVAAGGLDDLVARYGAEAVMSAAGGMVPATAEEVAAATIVLEAGLWAEAIARLPAETEETL